MSDAIAVVVTMFFCVGLLFSPIFYSESEPATCFGSGVAVCTRCRTEYK